jgi:MerR family transcriptional regulator, copper efflux regulator
MNIGQVAARAGVSAKTIRYYEDVGLIRPAARADNGYRAYSGTDVHVLRFVQRARSLGFSVEECRRLLALWQDPGRASGDVKAMALKRIAEIDGKMAELRGMRRTLVHLAEHCHGDTRPHCPILDDLADGTDERRDRAQSETANGGER